MEFKRLLIKLSGEALKNNKQGICDFDYVLELCKKIANLLKKGYQIGIVVGGGNLWRGRDNTYIDSDISDKIGILSTTMNSLILNAAFKELEIESKVFNSAFIENLVDKASIERIEDELKNNTILIFGGGTGEVGCSTDTAAAQRAIDMKADIIIKLTNVDGIYDKDPDVYSNAKMYKTISYQEVIENELKVMDERSFILCMENNIPIIVSNINKDIELSLNLKDCTIVGNFI